MPKGEIDPAVWGKNFPHQYDSFNLTEEDHGKTKYGGSTPYSKLEAYPAMVRLWAGYSFSKGHNEERVEIIQDTTAGLLRRSEEALLAAIDAIVEARESGVGKGELGDAMALHRAASLRWDFISSENSTGFHSPQEAARILAESIDLARQAELKAAQAIMLASTSR